MYMCVYVCVCLCISSCVSSYYCLRVRGECVAASANLYDISRVCEGKRERERERERGRERERVRMCECMYV